mgnify:CR=1 FL=1|tara:strand:+ start:605 stop:2086 length:1482 start_codon:yes stop_codon:yes gene_type:complete
MPVNQPTHEHEHWEAKATKDRMFLAGEESVKNAGEYFLPKLSGQATYEYRSMLDRTLFFNAARRTHSALLGLVHKKPVEVEVPAGGEDFTKSMDLSMNGHFDMFAKQVTDELLQVGRVGVAVDYDNISGRPYAVTYRGEDIISATYADRHSVSDYSRIVLCEHEKVETEDEFEEKFVKIFRVKKLTPTGMVEEIYRSKDQKEYFLDETIVPTRNGQPLDRIPFVIFATNGCYAEYQESLLHDIISVNVQHYITSADLGTVLHFSALPTLVISGVQGEQDDTTPIRLGSTSAIMLPPSVDSKILEFTGASAAQLRSHLRELEQRMAVLGSRVLQPDQRPQTATAESIKSASEMTSLQGMVSSLSHGMKHVLDYMLWWSNLPEESLVRFNTDFNVQKLEAGQLAALTKALIDGAIDQETFMHNLKQGELLPPTKQHMHNQPAQETTTPTPVDQTHMDQMVGAGMTDEEIIQMHSEADPAELQAQIDAMRDQYGTV